MEVAAYFGETGRYAYCRSGEHLDNLALQDEDKSILWANSVHHHNNRVDVKYMMKVSGMHKEPLDRQIMKRIKISNFQGPALMNRRNEMGGLRVERWKYRRWGGGGD